MNRTSIASGPHRLPSAAAPQSGLSARPGSACALSAPSQRGISLVFSLITLAALSLAAVALIRSVDTGSTILGNLSFKQDSALATEEASRQAIGWIYGQLNGTSLHANNAEGWYQASNVPLLDPLGTNSNNARAVIDWSGGTNCSAYSAGSFTGGCIPSRAADAQNGATPGLKNGVTARYVVVRLCSGPGDPSTVTCARPLKDTQAGGTEHNALANSETSFAEQPTQSQYYRVIVRAQGGRKTVTYTETLVHF